MHEPGMRIRLLPPLLVQILLPVPLMSSETTLLFAEHLTEQVLLDLPHCQFVFSIPKALRVFFRYDQRLFADVSRLIYRMIIDFYTEAAGRPITGAAILAFWY